MKEVNWLKRNEKLFPWVAGAGIAVSHIVVSSNCTIPTEGRCSTCGSCVVALATLVGWALSKKGQENNFYGDSNEPI